MTHSSEIPDRGSTAELYAAAYRGEVAAAERYTDLAEQSGVRRTPEVAELFRTLARAEWQHASLLAQEAADKIRSADPEARAPMARIAADAIDREIFDPSLTPSEALSTALEGERRAVAYFDRIGEVTDDAKLRALATALRDEEIEHVRLCSGLLKRYPAGGVPGHDDLEPTLPAG